MDSLPKRPLLIVLLLLSIQVSWSWTTCAEIEDCDTCSKATGCHFCAFDSKCHAIGSVSGCTYGLACSDLRDCVRHSSEFKGYQNPSVLAISLIGAVTAVILGALLSIILCTCWLCERRAWKKYLLRQRAAAGSLSPESGAEYVELTNTDPSSDLRPLSASDGGEDDSLTIPALPTHISDPVVIPSSDGPFPRPSAFVGGPRVVHEPVAHKPSWFMAFCKCASVSVIAGCILAAVIAALYTPHAPQYSVCTTKVEWTSLLSGLTSGALLSVDVDLHVSIYNPNRFRVEVRNADARVYYRHQLVGSGSISDVTFDAGATSDIVMLANFQPGLANAWNMYRDHQNQALLVDLDFDLSTDVYAFSSRVFGFNTTYRASQVDVDGPADRSLCKCNDL